MKLIIAQDITIAQLRTYLPDWRWVTRRQGCRWVYDGYFDKPQRSVSIEPRACLTGLTEDDSKTRWFVYEEGQATDLDRWLATEV